jgi:uncharacterized protein (DUF58 family)
MRSIPVSRNITITLILFLLLAWAVSGVIIYLRIFFIAILLIFGSYLWIFISIREIKFHRSARNLRTSVGTIFDERFEITNGSIFPNPWLEIKNNSSLPHKSGSRVIAGLGARHQRTYIARTWITKRGAFNLGPTLLTAWDPFGIFSKNRIVPAEDTLLVLPYTVDIPYFPFPKGILPGGKDIFQRTLDITPHATGVRDYLPGDPMKRVHWPSTARQGKFIVKEYELDPQAEVWFFLDANKSVQFSQKSDLEIAVNDDLVIHRRTQIKLPRDSFEYGISTTASLVKYFDRQKRSVGLISQSSKLTMIQADRGVRQLNRILEMLAFIKADGTLPISSSLDMFSKLLPIGSACFITTPTITSSLIVSIDELLRRNLQPTLIYIADEKGKINKGHAKLLDSIKLKGLPIFKIYCNENLEPQLTGFHQNRFARYQN